MLIINKYAQIPQQVNVSAKLKGKLTIECDEAWSFVGHKDNKQWIWLALDNKTREIVGVYIGDISKIVTFCGKRTLKSFFDTET